MIKIKLSMKNNMEKNLNLTFLSYPTKNMNLKECINKKHLL